MRFGPIRSRLQSILNKVNEKGIGHCVKGLIRLILHPLNKITIIMQAAYHYAASFNNPNSDSVLAIYDLRVSPYTFNFVEFLANAEAFRMMNSLSSIDVAIVVDREKLHRGDQPCVTEANYRNWILNLAEATDVLESMTSLSIFDAKKFLGFYRRVRQNHVIFPDNGVLYFPKIAYHLTFTSDYYRMSGYAPKFKSSGILLDWAEGYFHQKCCPMIPIVVFVRNASNHLRNTNWPAWLDFFRQVIDPYPVKFFIVNDFWNPLTVPEDLQSRVLVSTEATISVKYRAALTQKASLIMGTSHGSFAHCIFNETPYLLFGMDNVEFNAKLNISLHGMTEDLQFPWATKYQRVFPEQADTTNLKDKFEGMYALLQKDGKLIPSYYNYSEDERNKFEN